MQVRRKSKFMAILNSVTSNSRVTQPRKLLSFVNLNVHFLNIFKWIFKMTVKAFKKPQLLNSHLMSAIYSRFQSIPGDQEWLIRIQYPQAVQMLSARLQRDILLYYTTEKNQDAAEKYQWNFKTILMDSSIENDYSWNKWFMLLKNICAEI